MTLFIILISIIVIHWIADFVLQRDADAKGKSTSVTHLLNHTATYSLVWYAVALICIFTGILPSVFVWFAPITFLVHTATDYCTSKLNSYLWAKGDVHNFFVSVGFDQVLHYIQLFGTFFLLVYSCK